MSANPELLLLPSLDLYFGSHKPVLYICESVSVTVFTYKSYFLQMVFAPLFNKMVGGGEANSQKKTQGYGNVQDLGRSI